MDQLITVSSLNDALLEGIVAFQEIKERGYCYSYLTQCYSVTEALNSPAPSNIEDLDEPDAVIDLIKNNIIEIQPQTFVGRCFTLVHAPNSIEASDYTDPNRHVITGELILAPDSFSFTPTKQPREPKQHANGGFWSMPALCLLDREQGVLKYALVEPSSLTQGADHE